MPDPMRPRRCSPLAGLLLMACVALTPLATAADLAPPRPFEARYRLALDDWPDLTIDHRLTRQGEHWQSRMQATAAIAEGSETGRFRMVGDAVEALLYTSRYRLMGFGEHFRLDADQLATLPDRQTALFSLARRATSAECREDAREADAREDNHDDTVAPCTLRYRDHEGEKEALDYRVVGVDRHATPAGSFPAVTLEAWSPDKPERRLTLIFHREVPGLLLGMSYRRDGERRSHLSLTRVTIEEDKSH